jgi:hypothetical protein
MRRALSSLAAVLAAAACAGSVQAARATDVEPAPLLASVSSEAQTVYEDVQKLLPEIPSESHREIAQLERLESDLRQLTAAVDELRAKIAARQLSVADIRKVSAAIGANLAATRQVQHTLALRHRTAGTTIDPVLWNQTIAAVRRLDVLDTRLQSELLALKRACQTGVHPPTLCK